MMRTYSEIVQVNRIDCSFGGVDWKQRLESSILCSLYCSEKSIVNWNSFEHDRDCLGSLRNRPTIELNSKICCSPLSAGDQNIDVDRGITVKHVKNMARSSFRVREVVCIFTYEWENVSCLAVVSVRTHQNDSSSQHSDSIVVLVNSTESFASSRLSLTAECSSRLHFWRFDTHETKSEHWSIHTPSAVSDLSFSIVGPQLVSSIECLVL